MARVPLVLSIANACLLMAAMARDALSWPRWPLRQRPSECNRPSPDHRFHLPVPYRSPATLPQHHLHLHYRYPPQRRPTSGIADAVCDPFSGLCTTLRPAYCESSPDTVDYFSNRRLTHTLRESPSPRRALLSACPSFDMLYDPCRLSFLPPVLLVSSSSPTCSWTPNRNAPKPAMQTCHRPDSSPHRDR